MNLPMPEYGANDKETIQNLMDTVVKLRKELEYLMYHLGDANIPDLAGMKGDINGNHSLILQAEDEIELLVTDVAGHTSSLTVQAGQIQSLVTTTSGHTSSITQQAGQIQSLVSTTDGHTSSITQLSGQITLKVNANGVISAINLSSEVASIDASKINLNGVVTMTNLAQVYGTFRLGSPGATWARMYIADGNMITGENDAITIEPTSGYTSGEIWLKAQYVRAYGMMTVGDLNVSGSHNIVAKFG